MNNTVFCSPERVSEVARELAARQKAFAVNAGVISRQNGTELVAALTAADGQTRAAAETLIAALAAGPKWPETLHRDLANFVRALGRLIKSGRPRADDAETLAWQMARMNELAAQLRQIDAIASLLGMLRSNARLGAFKHSELRQTRRPRR